MHCIYKCIYCNPVESNADLGLARVALGELFPVEVLGHKSVNFGFRAIWMIFGRRLPLFGKCVIVNKGLEYGSRFTYVGPRAIRRPDVRGAASYKRTR